MNETGRIEPQRIGTGVAYFVFGWLAIAIGLFVGIGSSSSYAGVSAGSVFGSLLIGLGGALIAVGFWVKLFGLVERRLMDIEARLTPPKPAEAVSAADAGEQVELY